MNVDDMTDEEFIDYCRNGGELSGLITERHPKCDWCGGMCRVGKDGMCRNCRVRERRRTDPEYAQHLRDLANRRNARNREKRNEYARRYRSEHLAQAMQLDAHRTYLHVFSAESSDTQPIIPSYVDTVELLDDPNYERIEEADDLQEKDIAVMLDGNRYKVTDVEKGRNRFWGRVYGAVGPECIALGFNAFTYGLRPKPRLPDKPGLWLDKDDNTWVMGENAFPLTCIDAGNWSITRPQFSTDSVQVLNAAPFRLAKAVEA